MGKVSLILPEATTNFCPNPSVETNTTGWTATRSVLTRDTDVSKFGSYSLLVTANNVPASTVFGSPPTSETVVSRGTPYTASAWVKGESGTTVGRTLTVTCQENGGAAASARTLGTITLTADWQLVTCTHTIVEPDRTGMTSEIWVGATSIGDKYWIDGYDFVQLDHVTTHIDGDQEGCEWDGVPHASTSTRSAQSRAGGRVIDLDDFNISVDSLFGFEMPPLLHNVHDQPQQPGAFLQSIKVLPRILQMNCHTETNSECTMYDARKQLIHAIDPDLVATLQPVLLRYTATEDCTDEDAVDCAPFPLEFNGSTSSVNCGSPPQTDDMPGRAAGTLFTAEAWIRADGYGENNQGFIFDKTGSAASGWYFGIINTGGLIAQFYSDAVTGLAISGLDDFTADGLWHHVAVTYDNGTGIVRFWIDGVEPDYDTQQNATGNYAFDNADDLLIGNRSDGARAWDGGIGWCRVSDDLQYTATFTPPPQCTLPVIVADTYAQWIKEGEGTAIDNMEGTAAADGTASNTLWGASCTCDVAGVPVEIGCYYDSGLEGQWTIHCYDTFLLRLICYEPMWSQVGETSELMATTQSLANTRTAIAKINGEFTQLGPPTTGGEVNAIVENDRYVFVAGAFGSWNGIANANNIVQYEKATGIWSALVTGRNAVIHDMDIGPDGTLYVVGDFVDANQEWFSTWNGAVWGTLGDPDGAGAAVVRHTWAVKVGPEGNVWVGGDFDNWAGNANQDMATYWNGAAWTDVTAGANFAVRAVVIAPDRTKYFGGDFTGWGDADGDRIVSFTIGGGLVSMLGGIQNNSVLALAVNNTGLLYIGGTFTAAGDIPAADIVAWDGNAYVTLGSGPGGDIYGLTVAPDSYLYAVGDLASVLEAVKWNGYTWSDIPLSFPAATIAKAVRTMDRDPVVPANYDVWWGCDTAGTYVTAATTTIINNGSAPAFPVIRMTRVGGTEVTLRSIRNETTGDEILMELNILDGETITLDLRTGKKTLTSDWRGNLAGVILPNSNFATFSLQTGTNVISIFRTSAGGPTALTFMRWKEQYLSVSGAS